MTEDLLSALSRIVGEDNLIGAAQLKERARHFWDASPLVAKALVRPASTDETSRVLAACHAVGQSVVTHGGITGLVDGDRTGTDDIVLSLERQQQILDVDTIGRTITVQAGVILQNVQSAAAESGLMLGLDLGARGSCTIGGNLATNAGGLSVLRYGMAREQVLGLEVVLADGTVLSSMSAMIKNNAGYDLIHLFIGSEGTLGVITKAVLRLRADTPHKATALLAFDQFENVTRCLSHLDKNLNGVLNAFEVMWQPFYRLNTHADRQDTVREPLSGDHPLYAIVETRGASESTSSHALEAALETLLETQCITDAVVAQSEKEASNIWFIREHIDIALEPTLVFAYDISLPIVSMQNYVEQLEREVQATWRDASLYVYGHLADGNLHILISPDENSDCLRDIEQLLADSSTHIPRSKHDLWYQYSNQLVYAPLQELGGSISAEHGIGLLKKDYLKLSRSSSEIELMKTIKQTLDPKRILNAGKIFD